MNFIFGGKKDQKKSNGLSSSARPNIVQLPQVIHSPSFSVML